MGVQIDPEHGPPRATNAVAHRRADVRAAAQRLGFAAAVGLEAGLADLVSWWRAERALVGAKA
jgi:UDP-glucose 4-epimerase